MENLTLAMLTDRGICPTCYDKENNHCLYGDNKDRMLYENELFEVFLVNKPKAEGHTILSSKKHDKDYDGNTGRFMQRNFCVCKKDDECIKRGICCRKCISMYDV